MNLLGKLQKQPENVRKVIFWVVIIIIGFGLAIWWAKDFRERLKSLRESEFIREFQLPSLEKEFEELENIETLKLETEDLEKIMEKIDKEEE